MQAPTKKPSKNFAQAAGSATSNKKTETKAPLQSRGGAKVSEAATHKSPDRDGDEAAQLMIKIMQLEAVARGRSVTDSQYTLILNRLFVANGLSPINIPEGTFDGCPGLGNEEAVPQTKV